MQIIIFKKESNAEELKVVVISNKVHIKIELN